MAGHYVKNIELQKPDKRNLIESLFETEVWIHSTGTNDDRPFEWWHSRSLSEIYQTKGLIGLSQEISKTIQSGDFQIV